MQPSDFSILVIDDTDIMLQLVELHLSSEGYQVTSIQNPLQAFALLDSQPFDLILLDIEMPEISGIDLLKHIRRNNRSQKTPVFMLTGNSEIEQVKICLSAGANDYLVKPFDADTFKHRINQFFKKYQT